MAGTVTCAELGLLCGRSDVVLLDTRPIAAYNGWVLGAERRGGHVPGARPFPAEWLASLGEERALAALRRLGAVPDRTLAVVGDAAALEGLGFADVRALAGGAAAWATDPWRPLECLPRFHRLVHPGWLAALLDRRWQRTVVAHVAFDNPGDYERGHVPSAIYLDTLELEEPERWNRRTPEELERALCRQGITWDTTVVLTGRTGSSSTEQEQPGREAGQIAAMRAALLLMYAGVEDVRVLDGGLGAWQRAGLPVERTRRRPQPVTAFGCRVPARPELIVDIDEVRTILADPGARLVSVRSWAEYVGAVSGYRYVRPRGRIPGSVFGNCGSDAYHMQNYRNHDDTMRDYHEIASAWAEVGVTPERRVAFYCGTGWRAAEAFFAAYLMAWPQIAVYDGGWFEWSIDTENPLETGIPPLDPMQEDEMYTYDDERYTM